MLSRKKRGFTLAELLIVIAILGVLVAVAFPVFTSSLDNAKRVTCEANRRNLRAALSTAYLTKTKTFTPGETVALTGDEAKDYSCPAGGTISYQLTTEGQIEITCSVHDGTEDAGGGAQSTPATAQDITDMLTAIAGLDAVQKTGYTVDSLAVKSDGSNTPTDAVSAVTGNATAQSTLSSLGATLWKYQGNNSFTWTTADISALKVGDTVPVIKYNLQEGAYKGLYTVWTYKVEQSKQGPYLALPLSGTQYTVSAGAASADKTLENAQKWYAELAGGT